MPPRSSKTYYDEDEYHDGYDDYDDDYEEYDGKSYGGPKAPSKPVAKPAAKAVIKAASKAAVLKPKATAAPVAAVTPPPSTPPPAAQKPAFPSASPSRPRPPYRDPTTYTADRTLQQALAKQPPGKAPLHVVVLGHVDAGKSTLMGRMVADLGFVDARTVLKTQQEAQQAGRGSFGWAWAFDERPEERERGVTIDVSTRHIETPRFAVTLLDAPGHKDFVPNMIMGATQADAALLVVDGSPGSFESSFNPSALPACSGEVRVSAGAGGQTREHVHVARSVGIKQLAVVVTKLDTCGYNEGRFAEVRAALSPFLAECSFREPQWLPACAPDGQNVVAPPTDTRLSGWWPEGCTVVDAIDRFEAVVRPVSLPLRMIISDFVSKKSLAGKVGVAGKIHAGAVCVGASVRILPSNVLATVKAIEAQGVAVPVATASAAVEVRILVVHVPRPLIPGQSAVLHMHASAATCRITALVSLLNLKTGAVVKGGPAFRVLLKDQAAIVDLDIDEEVCVECVEGQSCLSRLVLRMGGAMVASGTVLAVLDSPQAC